MNIAIYRNPNGHSHPWENAFADGVRAHGLEPVFGEVTARGELMIRDADLAVTWSVKHRHINERQAEAGKRTLVLERGYFKDRFLYTSIGFDGLNGRADFCNDDVPGDRWARHGEGVMSPWRSPPEDRIALIAGQVPGDNAIRGRVDFRKWVANAVRACHEANYQPMFRPHPGAPDYAIDACPTLPADVTLDQALRLAAFVVTFNSNLAVDALMAGVPAIACDDGSMAWDCAAHGLDALPPPAAPRQRWAERLAYCQWTLDEIASGEAWDHIKQGVNGQ